MKKILKYGALTLVFLLIQTRMAAMKKNIPSFILLMAKMEEEESLREFEKAFRYYAANANLADLQGLVKTADNRKTEWDSMCTLLESKGYLDIAKVALDGGAKVTEVNLISQHGIITPVLIAASRGRLKYLKYFLSKGCDINSTFTPSEVPVTATDFALVLNNVRTASYLLYHGGKSTLDSLICNTARSVIMAFRDVLEDKLTPEKFLEKYLTIDQKAIETCGTPISQKELNNNISCIQRLLYLDKNKKLAKPFNNLFNKASSTNNLLQQLK